jgi:peptidoglycan hydrolase CwlO-like protein
MPDTSSKIEELSNKLKSLYEEEDLLNRLIEGYDGKLKTGQRMIEEFSINLSSNHRALYLNSNTRTMVIWMKASVNRQLAKISVQVVKLCAQINELKKQNEGGQSV